MAKKSTAAKARPAARPRAKTATRARAPATARQPRPVIAPPSTTLTVDNQDAADREIASRVRLRDEAASRDSDRQRIELEKAPGKPFKPARDALNKLAEEIRNMRDTDRTHWKASEMRRFRDELYGLTRELEPMVTGDAD
jgi:hypothetical protein